MLGRGRAAAGRRGRMPHTGPPPLRTRRPPFAACRGCAAQAGGGVRSGRAAVGEGGTHRVPISLLHAPPALRRRRLQGACSKGGGGVSVGKGSSRRGRHAPGRLAPRDRAQHRRRPAAPSRSAPARKVGRNVNPRTNKRAWVAQEAPCYCNRVWRAFRCSVGTARAVAVATRGPVARRLPRGE